MEIENPGASKSHWFTKRNFKHFLRFTNISLIELKFFTPKFWRRGGIEGSMNQILYAITRSRPLSPQICMWVVVMGCRHDYACWERFYATAAARRGHRAAAGSWNWSRRRNRCWRWISGCGGTEKGLSTCSVGSGSGSQVSPWRSAMAEPKIDLLSFIFLSIFLGFFHFLVSLDEGFFVFLFLWIGVFAEFLGLNGFFWVWGFWGWMVSLSLCSWLFFWVWGFC